MINRLAFIIILLVIPMVGWANTFEMDLLKITPDEQGQQTFSVNIQILAVMTLLTLLPAIVLMMTSFTRIVIVLAILRQALGMPQTPSNQIIIGLALFLSFFIMSPVLTQVHSQAITPYTENQLDAQQALEKAAGPIKAFMLEQTRTADLNLFFSLSGLPEPTNLEKDVPLSVLLPAFITSELKTAFQIGFIIFIPFLIIDMVVASVLMSMGMMMMSPLIISLPFKLMLFVLVDGWNLLLGTLANSFITGA